MPPNWCDQRLGQRLGVAARDGQSEQIFDQLMVEQRLRPAFEQALAKAGAVPGRITRNCRPIRIRLLGDNHCRLQRLRVDAANGTVAGSGGLVKPMAERLK